MYGGFHLVLGLFVITAFSTSCRKDIHEVVRSGAVSNAVTPKLGERFRPSKEDVMPLIKQFKQVKTAIAIGVKSDGEKPIQEALWLNEALMNYEKGDATKVGDDWLEGTYTYTFPINTKADGSVWVDDGELVASYDNAKDAIIALLGESKVYMFDHEIMSVENGVATIEIKWLDKIEGVGDEEFSGVSWDGTGLGCMNAVQGAYAIDFLRRKNFPGQAIAPGDVVVSIFSWFNSVTDIRGYSLGYPYYYGTNLSFGIAGTGLLYSGPNTGLPICFPEQWQRYLEVRQNTLDFAQLRPYESLVRESFEWSYYQRTGTAFEYGSIFYPMGPYDHTWYWTIGMIVGANE